MSESTVDGPDRDPRPQLAANLALALERLLTDPAGRQRLKRNRENAPTWLRDQDDAATARAVDALAAVGGLLQSPVEDTTITDLPGWVRLGMLNAFAAWQTGEASTCVHAPNPRRPEPVYAVAWRPGLVVCQRCVHLTALRPGSVADRTCDGCGHVAAGLEHGEGIHPDHIQYGPLLYGFGACDACQAETLAARA